MHALVLGASGAVGTVIVETLRSRGIRTIAAGRRPGADLIVDPSGPFDVVSDAIATAHASVVVNASGVEAPALVRASARAGAAFVEISATETYLARVAGGRFDVPVLLGVGLAPGLTNLLAEDVASRSEPSMPIDIGIVLGAGDAHGAAAAAWTSGLLGRRFPDPGTGRPVRNFTEARTFRLPDGRHRRLLRADFADQHTLTRTLGRTVRTSFATDDRSSTALLAILTRIPGARRLPTGIHLPGGDRWTVLAEAADGALSWATGRGQSRATGVIAALAAVGSAALPAGVHQLNAAVSLDRVRELDGFQVSARQHP
ncbi:saccharopine dehydrogenase [Plantibacter flavus]|uniref:saccharopine dehydrogenase n=1 Tax=Plantibacter flavus TaxID=150123 RepID=UPI003F178A8F